MTFKRKRSFSELDTSPSSVSSTRSSASSLFSAWPTSPTPPTARRPDHSGRTMKRHRDDRPDDETVHQRTLAALYDAQRRPASPVPTTELAREPATTVSVLPQTSLHSFWRLPTIRPAFTVSDPGVEADNTRRCEDCDASLVDVTAMDVDGEESASGEGSACSTCGRRVCDVCAVRGDQRTCLNCAVAR